MIRQRLKSLSQDTRGANMIEFALISPVLMIFLMATFDLGYREYIYSVLEGEVQKAARDSSLEGGSGAVASIDARVRNRVEPLVGNGNFEFTRKNFSSFTQEGQAETFTDSNNNGVRDAGECFQDDNGNGTWDNAANAGRNGQGGARDIVLYKAKVTYPRVFPMYELLGWSQNEVLEARTVLRNQPFGAQRAVAAVCT